jgi:hypothetical protein
VTAAAALGAGEDEAEDEAAADALARLSATRGSRRRPAPRGGPRARAGSRARASGRCWSADVRRQPAVARAAVQQRRHHRGAGDFLLVPPLVSLLRNRRLKREPARRCWSATARRWSMRSPTSCRPGRGPWVRRHVPARWRRSRARVGAGAARGARRPRRLPALQGHHRPRADPPRIPSPRPRGHRTARPDRGRRRAFSALTLYTNLFVTGGVSTCLLARVLEEKRRRAMNRVFQLLGPDASRPPTSPPWQATLGGDAGRARAPPSTSTTCSSGDVRKRVMLLVEDMPTRRTRAQGQRHLPHARARRRGHARAAGARREPGGRGGRPSCWSRSAGCGRSPATSSTCWQHRDPRDWYVFEAASWALAASRMPASGVASSGRSRCRRWCWSIGCAASDSSTSPR